MKKILYVLILTLITSCPVKCEDAILLEENIVHEETVIQDEGLVPDEAVLDVDIPHEELFEIREIPDISKPQKFETYTFKERVSKGVEDVYKLQRSIHKKI